MEEVVLIGFRLQIPAARWDAVCATSGGTVGAAVLCCGLLLGEQEPTGAVRSHNTHAKSKSRKKKIIRNLPIFSVFAHKSEAACVIFPQITQNSISHV